MGSCAKRQSADIIKSSKAAETSHNVNIQQQQKQEKVSLNKSLQDNKTVLKKPTQQPVTSIEQMKVSTKNFIIKQEGALRKNYRIMEVLGDGAFGKVRKALHIPTNSERAIKTISKESVEKAQGSEKFFVEVEILKSIDHPNILRLYEFYEDERNYHLVTELCTGGELFDKIIEKQKFSEIYAAKIMHQVLSAIVYCHSKRIVHRDLKPENLLLENKDDNAPIKIIDFGTSQFFDPDRKMHLKFGTPYYIAPEVLRRRYDEKCDIWSCGVIMYILLCGYPPFSGGSDDIILQKVQRGNFSFDDKIWDKVSDDAKDLIKKMLTKATDQRPSAQECLSHVWIQSRVQKEEVEKPVTIQSLQNLQQFRNSQKLTQAVTAFIVSQLTSNEERKEMEKVFKLLDTNNDGKLSREELQEGYSKHLSRLEAEEMVQKIMEQVDTDGSGFVDFSEFIAATMDRKKLLSKEKIESAFRLFDKDASGSISSQELKILLGGQEQIQENVWQQIIKEVDGDGNGEVII